MANNLGLLSGLATGLREGLQSYRDERDYQDKKRERQQALQSGLLKNNQQMDEQGNISLNDIGQAAQTLERLKTQAGTEAYDPTSQASQNARTFARQVAAKASPGLEKGITDDMNAAQLNEQAKGLLGEGIKGGYGMQGRLITSSRIGESNQIKRDSLDERKSVNASHAGQEFEKDPIIRLSKNNLNSLTKSQSILENPNKPITTKDLNLAYTDYINATAAGGAATEGKITRELPETWAQEYNILKGKAGEFDDLRSSPTGKKLIDMLKENIRTVRGDIKNAVSDQAQYIHDSYKFNNNKQVQQTIQDKLKSYAPERHAAIYGGGQETGQLPSQTQGLVKSDPGASGKIKVSNGKETLMIDPNDVTSAMKDGYQVVK